MATQSGQCLRKLLEPKAAGGGDRTRLMEFALSPVSPLERNPQSPKGWKKRESDGVGLGIVAALERSSSGEISPRIVSRTPGGLRSSFEAPELGCSGRCNGSDGWRLREGGDAAAACTCKEETKRKETWFYADYTAAAAAATKVEESESYRIADFLNCCNLCRKMLHGKDIYMYRGEKAFCSVECRYQQIISDECQENRGAGVRSTPEISSSPYSGAGQLFFTGIVVS